MTKWKFLVERSGRIESMYGRQVWTPSEWVEFDGALRLYHSGLHASPDPLSAMGYVAGDLLATVSTRGDSIESDDKSVHEAMRLDKVYRWRKEDSVALAVFSAELVIQNYEDAYPGDMRPRNAIEAAKAWLAASAESAVESAVESAARSAARSAAWSARSAAWSAVENAESAVESAVESAESAVESAARSAALDDPKKRISGWIVARTQELPEWEDVHAG